MLLLGDSCEDLDKILEKYFDGVLDGDDKCFDVITTLKTVSVINSFVYVTRAMLISYLKCFVFRMPGCCIFRLAFWQSLVSLL